MASFCSLLALLFTFIHATRGSCAYGYTANEEVPYIRNYFYVGGKYVSDGSGGHAFQDQMYVERLTPLGGPRNQRPLVFIPGAGQTGTV
jgi:hypothetical protein